MYSISCLAGFFLEVFWGVRKDALRPPSALAGTDDVLAIFRLGCLVASAVSLVEALVVAWEFVVGKEKMECRLGPSSGGVGGVMPLS